MMNKNKDIKKLKINAIEINIINMTDEERQKYKNHKKNIKKKMKT